MSARDSVHAAPRATRRAARRRGGRVTPLRVVMLAALLALVGAALAVMLQTAPRRSGANLTVDNGTSVYLVPGQEVCQTGELVPDRTAGIRVAAKAKGGRAGAIAARVVYAGTHTIASGRLAPGWRSGLVTVPLSRTLATVAGAIICLRPEGAPVAFGGSVPDGAYVVFINGQPLGGHLRLEYMRPGRESWLALAPVIAGRMALGKSQLVRHWAVAAALVLMLVAVAVAVTTVLATDPAAGSGDR